MRNPKINPYMIGFERLSENETNLKRLNGRTVSSRGRATERDPLYAPNEVADGFGVILHVLSKLVPAANEVFTPDELEAREAMHRARIAEEMARLEEELKKHKKTRVNSNSKGNTIQEWMYVVNCSVCKRVLIAPEQPELHATQWPSIVARRQDALARCIKKFGTPKRQVKEVVEKENGTPLCHRKWLCTNCA